MLENQTITNREAVVSELQNLQTQISSGITTYKVGDLYEGYVIAAIYKYNNINYAIIVSPDNSSDGIVWSNLANNHPSPALSTWDGAKNSDQIIKMVGFTTGAAKSALSYVEGGYTDWYLGAVDEWSEISKNMLVVNRKLDDEGMSIISPFSNYWTSTEDLGENNYAYSFGMYGMPVYCIQGYSKSQEKAVRPIRTVQL